MGYDKCMDKYRPVKLKPEEYIKPIIKLIINQ